MQRQEIKTLWRWKNGVYCPGGEKVKETRQRWECNNFEFAKLPHHWCIIYHLFWCCKMSTQWSGVQYQNRSVNSFGVNAVAQARWSRIMEERRRRRRATEYSITVDKEGGQVAQSMPHWGLCGIVRLQQLLLRMRLRPKLLPPQRMKTKTRIEVHFNKNQI